MFATYGIEAYGIVPFESGNNYEEKYPSVGSDYNEKYFDKGTGYSEKHSASGSVYSDKYPTI